MTTGRLFPIQGGPAIPWSMIEPYAEQAMKNHGQTLERLAERGGLSPYEAVCCLNNRRLYDNKTWPHYSQDRGFYLAMLRDLIKKDQTDRITRLDALVATLEARIERVIEIQEHCGCTGLDDEGGTCRTQEEWKDIPSQWCHVCESVSILRGERD